MQGVVQSCSVARSPIRKGKRTDDNTTIRYVKFVGRRRVWTRRWLSQSIRLEQKESRLQKQRSIRLLPITQPQSEPLPLVESPFFPGSS